MRLRVTEYFDKSQNLIRTRHYRESIFKMIPSSLLQQTSLVTAKHWMEKIDFFEIEDKKEQIAFISSIILKLKYDLFPPQECIYVKGDLALHMYIVVKGTCSLGGTIYPIFSNFGEEMLMREATRPTPAIAVTYVDAAVLSRKDLVETLSTGRGVYVQTRVRVRAKIIKMTFTRVVRQIGRASIIVQRHEAEAAGREYKEPSLDELEVRRAELMRRARDYELTMLDTPEGQARREAMAKARQRRREAREAREETAGEKLSLAKEVLHFWCLYKDPTWGDFGDGGWHRFAPGSEHRVDELDQMLDIESFDYSKIEDHFTKELKQLQHSISRDFAARSSGLRNTLKQAVATCTEHLKGQIVEECDVMDEWIEHTSDSLGALQDSKLLQKHVRALAAKREEERLAKKAQKEAAKLGRPGSRAAARSPTGSRPQSRAGAPGGP